QFQSLVFNFLFVGTIVVSVMSFVVVSRIIGLDESRQLERATRTAHWLYVGEEFFVWGIASLGIFVALVGIYRVVISPTRASFVDCTVGAAAGATAWFCAILLFDLYAERAPWDTIYGALTGGIATLMWFYVSSYTALFGAAVAASSGAASSGAASSGAVSSGAVSSGRPRPEVASSC
ncbi:MAG: YhjD/YihY/BrkB family envelope integrity protein, partial [Hyphomicrobiaceae bacterium]